MKRNILWPVSFLVLLATAGTFVYQYDTSFLSINKSYSRNLIANPIPIRGDDGWDASNMSVSVAHGPGTYEDTAQFNISSATHPASFCTGMNDIPQPYAGSSQNGEANGWVYGATPERWDLVLRDASSNVIYKAPFTAVNNIWTKGVINYPLADDYSLCLESNQATPGNISASGFYWGQATNLAQATVMTPWVPCSSNVGGSWSANTTYGCRIRRVNDTASISYGLTLTGAPTSAALFLNVPDGLVIDTAKLGGGTGNTTSSIPSFVGRTWDGSTTTVGIQATYRNTTTVAIGYENSSAVGANVTQAAPFTYNSGDTLDVTFEVPIQGWGSQTVVAPNQAADLMGTLTYGIGSTCPAGSVLADGGSTANYPAYAARFGANFPDARGIFVRGTGTNATATSGNVGGSLGAIQNDQMQGHSHQIRSGSNLVYGVSGATLSGSGTGVASNPGGADTLSAFNMQTNGTNGTPRVGNSTQPSNISLTPCVWIVSQYAPVFIGGVTSSGTTGSARTNWARLTSNGSSCTVVEQGLGTWITGGTRNGDGDCTWTIASGEYSTGPYCTGIVWSASVGVVRYSTAPTTTSIRLVRALETLGSWANTDGTYFVQCIGAR